MKETTKEYLKKLAINILAIIVIATLACMLHGCRQIRYVEKPVIKHDTLIRRDIVVDSTTTHDSVFVRETGDTIYKYEYRYIDRYRLKTDTFIKVRVDTTTVVQYVEVEKRRTIKEIIQSGWNWLLVFLALIATGSAIYLIIKRKR